MKKWSDLNWKANELIIIHIIIEKDLNWQSSDIIYDNHVYFIYKTYKVYFKERRNKDLNVTFEKESNEKTED